MFFYLFGTTWPILGAISVQTGRQGDPKIDENGTLEHPKRHLENKNVPPTTQDYRKTKLFHLFGGTWAILCAILGPVGRQRKPKIMDFGTKSVKNREK